MGIQIAELHFQQPPSPDYLAVKRRAETVLGGELNASDSEEGKDAFLLIHKSHVMTYKDGAKVPAQSAILAAHKAIDIDSYAEQIQQSWGCDHAASLLEGSQHTLLVTEMLTRALEPADRVRLFHGVLQAAVEETKPAALVFQHSQQVVDPAAYLDACGKDSIHRPGALNVRFYNISNSDGDMIMDTRGLEEIGLHDLQCHFRELDPNDVSRVLYNSAIYIFENGPVIESGNTIAGIDPDAKWVCRFEESLLEPTRDILDLNPGPPFAAGKR